MNESSAHIPVEQLLRQEDWVRRLVRRLVRDENEADDIVQEAWVAALQNPPRHEGATRAWLGTVVRATVNRFRAIDFQRAGRERAALGSEPARPPADLLVEREERRRTVVEAVLGLAEPYRSTIILRYFEELKPGDIASRDGLPVTTVKSRLQRGLDRLRAELDAEYAGDRRAWLVPLAALFLPREAATGAVATAGAVTSAKSAVGSLLGAKSVVMATVVIALAALVTVPVLFTQGEDEAPPEVPPGHVRTPEEPDRPVLSSPDRRGAEFVPRTDPVSKARATPAPPAADAAPLVIPDPAAPAIAGWVRWRSGEPVDRVYVQAVKTLEEVWEVQTDHRGRFAFPDLPEGAFTIRARSFSTLKRVPDWGRFALLKTDPAKLENGVPRVAGFTIGIPLGKRESVAHGTRDLTLTVDFPVVFSGKAVDQRTDAPIAQLRPRINGCDGGRRLGDPDGRFRLVTNGPASFRLHFLGCLGYLPSEEREFVLHPAEHRNDVVVRLERGGALTGHVRRADGEKLGPVKAVVQSDGKQGGRIPPRFVGRDGRFKVEGISGTATLRLISVILPDLVKTGIPVASGQTVDLGELVLPRGGALTMKILDQDGRPVARAGVKIKNLATGVVSRGQPYRLVKHRFSLKAPVLSDDQGRWVHPALLPGDYRAMVRSRDGKLVGEREFRIVAGTTAAPEVILRPVTP